MLTRELLEITPNLAPSNMAEERAIADDRTSLVSELFARDCSRRLGRLTLLNRFYALLLAALLQPLVSFNAERSMGAAGGRSPAGNRPGGGLRAPASMRARPAPLIQFSACV